MTTAKLFIHASPLVTMTEQGRAPLGVVDDGAFLVDEAGVIRWVGTTADAARLEHSAERVDLGGAMVLPGFVEAHTHLVFAGDRTHDYALRCAGASYEKVAEEGGGIRLTVSATREASETELFDLAMARAWEFLKQGVTTLEVKSGYGQNLASELKCLEIIRRLAEEGPCRIVPTCLAAHIVPDEYRGRRGDYIRMVTEELLPEVASRGLADFVDVFCEVGAYELDETREIFEKAVSLGLGIKVHAEQLSHTGAARLAAEYGAVSADHCEYIVQADAEILAASGTVAVLLPGAGLFLGAKHAPPARMLIDAGVKVALSTDFNPGTCPSTHLPLMTTLGCSWLGMSTAESLQGITTHAAQALGLNDGRGSIKVGAFGDFVVCNVSHYEEIPYRMGHHPVAQVWTGGECVYSGGR